VGRKRLWDEARAEVGKSRGKKAEESEEIGNIDGPAEEIENGTTT
jgi:hypothetical protein